MEQKECELIGYWTHYVTFITLTLDFYSQILKKHIPGIGGKIDMD